MRNTIYRFGFVAIVLCCPLLCAEEPRIWKDDTGLFSIEASLEQIDGDSVKLKKTDGTSIILPVSKLSAADRQYIANLSANNPFGSGGNTAAQQPKLGFASFAGLAVKAVDLSQARDVGGNAPTNWSGGVDPAPPLEQLADVSRLTFSMQGVPERAMPRRTDFFVAGNKVVTAFNVPAEIGNRTSEKNFTRICIGFIDTGDSMINDTPLKLRPLGISPDGKRVLFHQDTWEFPTFGKRTLMHLAEITEQGWAAVATFEPFAEQKRTGNAASSGADIYGATWVDNEHVLVQSESTTLFLLNVNTGKALWKNRITQRGDIALSPGKKYCFLPIGSRTVLCETMTGKALGAVDNMQSLKLRFSPDGKRFATCNSQGIMLGDTATGKVETPFFVAGSTNTLPMFWIDDRYFLCGGNMVDTTHKTTVWTYTGLRDNTKFVDGYCWCLFDRMRQDAILTAVTLPHTTMPVVNNQPDGEAELALKQGSEVALVVEDSITKDRAAIRKSIEKKIADNGWKISDAAEISIILKIEEEKADKVSYTASSRPFPLPPIPRPSFRGQGGVEVEFQPERYCLSIVKGEKEIWGMNKLTSPPAQLPLDVVKDASLQEVIDKEMEQLNYKEWLEKLNIPKTIVRKQEGKGESRVTENGIE